MFTLMTVLIVWDKTLAREEYEGGRIEKAVACVVRERVMRRIAYRDG